MADMRHITEMPWGSFWLRIIRDSVPVVSESFAWSKYGGKRKALAAARALRDKTLSVTPASRSVRDHAYRKIPMAHKTSHPHAGICRSVYRRTSGRYLRYLVNYDCPQRGPQRRTFQVGNIETITDADERHAERTARAFRREWEHCRDTGQRFNPDRYCHWRDERLYR